jgi:predicted AAA+ superfamily ATPase
VDLLEDDTFNQLTSSPQRLEALIDSEKAQTVIIDEVQKIPRILDEVHRLIEKRKVRFILTGSSARKLKRPDANLLAGRALTCFMHPFTAAELGSEYNFKHSLQFGSLPLAYSSEDPRAYLKSYITTYLKEEVQQEGLTRNLGAFSRFLEGCSFAQAQVLSISDIARQCAIERKVVEQYFIILEDLLLAMRLPVFSKKAKREMTQHPKFFIFDNGVFRALRPRGPLDSPEDIDGASFETLLFQEARALNDYLGLEYQLSFWRTRSKLEVDLVLYGERGLIAFEVKRAQMLRNEDFRGLRAFKEDYPQARTILLYGGSKRMREGSTELIPFAEGLAELPHILKAP